MSVPIELTANNGNGLAVFGSFSLVSVLDASVVVAVLLCDVIELELDASVGFD